MLQLVPELNARRIAMTSMRFREECVKKLYFQVTACLVEFLPTVVFLLVWEKTVRILVAVKLLIQSLEIVVALLGIR